MCETILITGGTGFLGSYVVDLLSMKGYSLILAKKSSSNINRIKREYHKNIYFYDIDKDNIEEIFRKHAVDTVINMAVSYGKKSEKLSDVLMANILLPVKLIELCSKYRVSFFINTDTVLNRNSNIYAFTKACLVDLLKKARFNTAILNLKVEYMYGPGEPRDRFIPWLIESFFSNSESIDLTSGEQKRDFVYITDAADIYLKIIENKSVFLNGFSEYRIGTRRFLDIKSVVEMIKNKIPCSNTKLNFSAIKKTTEETLPQADIKYIDEVLGPMVFTPFGEGIDKTIEWYRELNKGGES